MKKLSAWAAIIAVPTAMPGFFGQNVPYPGLRSVARIRRQHVGMVVIVIAVPERQEPRLALIIEAVVSPSRAEGC